jgi:hypothetical protein
VCKRSLESQQRGGGGCEEGGEFSSSAQAPHTAEKRTFASMRGAESLQAQLLSNQRRLLARRAIRSSYKSSVSTLSASPSRLFTETLPFLAVIFPLSSSPLDQLSVLLSHLSSYTTGTEMRRMPTAAAQRRANMSEEAQEHQWSRAGDVSEDHGQRRGEMESADADADVEDGIENID